MPRPPRDPRWLTARFDSPCQRCGAIIRKGARAFYYPNQRRIVCEKDECGGQDSRYFDAAKAYEAFFAGL